MDGQKIKQIANTIRGLSMDAVQKANSGHPGLPMGMADVGVVLFDEFLKFNPKDPNWFDRDRFVLSGGHGSMLLYSLLYLYGYDLSLDDLKNFRQWGSKTPGHPEHQDTPGVETTTGPLGQGLANAVGMAWTESFFAATFNRKAHKIVNHYTYVMLGDGDLQEGISHEVCSFAGHYKLNKLIALYDSNQITIDGATEISSSTDVEERFKAYQWDVQVVDGHKPDEVRKAISNAKESEFPSIIICKTIIGYGSPNKQGTPSVHGSPLGEEEIVLTKKNLGLPPEAFYVSEEVLEHTREAIQNGVSFEDNWNLLFDSYKENFPELASEFSQMLAGKIHNIEFPYFEFGQSMATRKASGKILETLVPQLKTLIGGSADLTPSNNTMTSYHTAYDANHRDGNYIHYGIREFGMAGMMNGMALHGGIIPYGGTFFVFSDYMRSAMRMAALMELPIIYVLTHDSIGLGEDGPTHQPVEHLAALRAIPNLVTFRPMDANETSMGWQIALDRNEGPTALILTRQNLPVITRDNTEVAYCTQAVRGGYVLTEDKNFEYIFISSGSEVHIALKAKELLNQKGKKVRVVSIPSMELFDQQDESYKSEVLPLNIKKRVAVEAAVSLPWYKYIGLEGAIVGLDRFGASAPIDILYEKLGITAVKVVEAALALK